MSRPVQLLHTNSTSTLLHVMIPAHEAEAGVTVDCRLDTGKGLVERILAGERGDAVILGEATLRDFARDGIVVAGSIRPFAIARIGVAVRRGFPKPQIGSVAALRDSLLAARAVAHTLHGASGKYIPTLFERLGIAEAMRPRTVTRPGGHIGPVVLAGEADIALQQLPELLAVEGLEVVGLLPEPVQHPLHSATAIFADAAEAAAARALLDFLARPIHAPRFAEHGLEQGLAPLRTEQGR